MNPDTLNIAILQTCSTTDQQRNVALVEPMIHNAISQGAEFISMAEAVNSMSYQRDIPLYSEEHDPFIKAMRAIAKNTQVWLHLGSVIITEKKKTYNRSLVLNPQGIIHQRYDKIHMFDVELEGKQIRESEQFSAGKTPHCVHTPWGDMGLSICYDLRFPNMYRQLAQAGCRLLLVPAAFTHTTGKAHWHTLLRARAIENSAWVIAANQCGIHEDGRHTYGHSLIVNPWGEIITEISQPTGVATAIIDLRQADAVRRQIPAWSVQ